MGRNGFLRGMVAALGLSAALWAQSAAADEPRVEATPVLYRVTIAEKIEVARDLLVSALEGRNYTIINQLDVQEGLAGRGIKAGPIRLIEFCNLSRAYQVTRSNHGFEMFAPCRLALFEENGKTKVEALRPRYVQTTLASEGLSADARQVLDEFDADVRAVLESAASGGF